MTGNVITGKPGSTDEPTTVPGPAFYEEELKDYSNTGNDKLFENLPEKHPEPAPEPNSSERSKQSV